MCYAFTKGRTIDTPLLEESFSLKFNKTFLYEGIDIYKTYNSFCGLGTD